MPKQTAKVELLRYTDNPDELVAAAAKLCYNNKTVNNILSNLTNEEVKKFVDKLTKLGHESPFEHASFTFVVTGVSRALTHQLVRNRIASYSQLSQRYVSEINFNYIVPKSIEKNEEAQKTFNNLMEEINSVYSKLVKAGIPKEDARYVLPNATETKIIVTMNARSLMNFFNHRCCTRAQWEIRDLANKMLALVKEVAPYTFKHSGASCVSKGYCPEADMSCGKSPTLKQLINK